MNKKFAFIIVAYLVVLCIPVVYGFVLSDDQQVFNGLVQNPIDGNSYLAKMQQGYRGEWRFSLAYTPEKSDGAFIFLFYILLGHFSRILHVPIIVMFHAARILGALFLAFTLIFWVKKLIRNSIIQITAITILLFGSGVGWLLLPFGLVATDMWVAEAYPFLSAMANPHFPLGIGLLLWTIHIYALPTTWKRCTLLFDLVLLLSLVLPFGVVLAGMIVGGSEIWSWFNDRKFDIVKLLLTMLGGSAYLLYQFFAIQNDPLLSQWNMQNVTRAPALYDFVLSFTPAIILAVLAIWKYRKDKTFFSRNFSLLMWVISGIVLLYFPFALQRRFLAGYFVPLVLLGGIFIDHLATEKPHKKAPVVFGLVTVSLLTNLLVFIGLMNGLRSSDSHYFLTRDEAAAIAWMDENAPSQSVVLSSPSLGNFIPARSDLKVVYGHPFETIQEASKQESITVFYSGGMDSEESRIWLKEMNVIFVVFGEREKEIGASLDNMSLQPVKQFGEIQVFQVTDE